MALTCITNSVEATKLEDGTLEFGEVLKAAEKVEEFPQDWSAERALSYIAEENKRTQRIAASIRKVGEKFITHNKILSSNDVLTIEG